MLYCQLSLHFWHCLARQLPSEQFSSSVTKTKLEAFLFCSEMNSAGYSMTEESIRLWKKYYSLRYMLNGDIQS